MAALSGRSSAICHERSMICASLTKALHRIIDAVEMPDQMAKNLILFIRQNDGKLGRRRRENEFATGAEVASLEAIVEEAFDHYV